MAEWNDETDLLVLGSGAAGLSGALRGAQLGLKVIVTEKSDVWGGSAAMSAGALWIPANDKMSAVGIDDSEADALEYLSAVTFGTIKTSRLQTFVRAANRMINAFEEDGQLRLQPLSLYPDYNTDVAGAKPGGRVLEPEPFDGSLLGSDFRTLHPPYPGELVFGRFLMGIAEARDLIMPGIGPKLGLLKGFVRYAKRRPERKRLGRDPYLTMGQALASRMRLSLTQRDVPVWLSCPIRSLVTDGGRVVGAELTRGGRPYRVRARAGVLMATGGFERSQEMRDQYLRGPSQANWTVGHAGNVGDGIIIGQEAGGAIDADLMREAWWAPTIVPPEQPTAWVLVIEKSLPHGFFVDRNGNRFTNEAANYSDVGRAMFEADDDSGAGVPAWWIFDATYRRRYIVGPIQPGSVQPDRFLPKALRPGRGWLHRAATLDELAGQLSIDPATLSRTVNRFNAIARSGDDGDFGRGRTLNDRYYADPRSVPNPSLGPLEKAPYYAVPVVPGDLGTKSGLVTDDDGRVLDETGVRIPGLYAAGNTTSSVMGPAYPGAGGTLAPAMAFAFLAAEAAAGDAHA